MWKLYRKGGQLHILCAFLMLVPGCAIQSECNHLTEKETILETNDLHAESTSRDAGEGQDVSQISCSEPNDTNVVFDSLWRDVWTLPETIVEETSEIIHTGNNSLYLLLAGGASVAMHNTPADREIAENFDLHRAIGRDMDEIVANLGGPGVHFAATGLWYAISVNNGDELNKQRSWTMMKALSVTGATTLALKLIVNNDTPNDKWLAWPSGHTASSFTVASVLDELYGPEVGFPAYLAAGFVGYRMMDSGDHWASDVLFGAVLGWIVGHHIGSEQKALELGGFEVVPYANVGTGDQAVGLSFVKRF
jgi:membrane-associated phospholipid phosphatase